MRILQTKIAKEISEAHKIPYRLAKEIVPDVFRIIAREVNDGNEVRITNFGKFALAKMKPRDVYDLNGNGEMLRIPGRTVPAFVPSNNFRKHEKGGSR